MKSRILWIDLSKVIAIWFIILGHFFPGVIKSFIYSFHVPIFFFISGFLTTHEPNNKIFWEKTRKKLIFPYLYINIINFIIYYFLQDVFGIDSKKFNVVGWGFNILCGIQGLDSPNNALGCSETWFIYTLICIKIIIHFVKKRYYLYLIFGSVIISFLFKSNINVFSWSIINVFISIPYFIMGIYLRNINYMDNIKNYTTKKLNFLFVLIFFIQYFLSYYNGVANMVINDYGKSILLFYVLGMSGSIMIFIISIIIERSSISQLYGNIIKTISSGTILILGFHMIFVRIFMCLFKLTFIEKDIFCYPASIIILLLFIPIIIFTHKHIPVLIGR